MVAGWSPCHIRCVRPRLQPQMQFWRSAQLKSGITDHMHQVINLTVQQKYKTCMSTHQWWNLVKETLGGRHALRSERTGWSVCMC